MSISGCVIALGFFDGVHIAHQKIIRRAVEYGEKHSLNVLALSFGASPLEILCPDNIKYITTNKEKEILISSLGARAEFLPMNEALLNMTAEEFVRDILVKKYDIKHAVCGYNYRFGHNSEGNTLTLMNLGKRYDFSVEVAECESLHGESVSSSRIRSLVMLGKIEEANELLGRSFSLSGIVSEGKQLGRKLGFPTANVFFDSSVLVPRNGVYKTAITVDGEKFTAITNTGINPTIGGERLRAETYIPGFDKNIYGREIRIEFLEFIRPEIKFDNYEALKKQIAKDIGKLS